MGLSPKVFEKDEYGGAKPRLTSGGAAGTEIDSPFAPSVGTVVINLAFRLLRSGFTR